MLSLMLIIDYPHHPCAHAGAFARSIGGYCVRKRTAHLKTLPECPPMLEKAYHLYSDLYTSMSPFLYTKIQYTYDAKRRELDRVTPKKM